jgi:hypothetical protein
MKNFTLIFLLSFLIVSCSKSKEAVYDKCLTQANETYGKNWQARSEFLFNCMYDKDYEFVASCDAQNADSRMLAICYVKK